MSHQVFIGLGSNLQDPQTQVNRAFQALMDLPHTRIAARSRLYRSAPQGFLSQPDFINAVALLNTMLEPLTLIHSLRHIESKHQRQRHFPNAPRTLDLDILLYDHLVLDSPQLVLPHPRMGQRAFVLRPLQELAPDLIVPGFGPISQLLCQCQGQDATPLEPS